MDSFRFNYFVRNHNSDSLMFQEYDNIIRQNTERQYETAIELVAGKPSSKIKSSRDQSSEKSSDWQIPSSLNDSSFKSNYCSYDFNFVKTNVVPSLRFADYKEQVSFKIIPTKAEKAKIPNKINDN